MAVTTNPAVTGVGGVASAAAAAPVDAVAATNTVTSNNTNVTAADTVTVNGKVYTFVAALTPAEGQVLRAGSADASLTNLEHAINGTGGTPGTDYSVAAAHPTVTAADVASHAITLTAITKGAAGNSLALAKSAATLTLGGALFSGGIDGTPGGVGAEVVNAGQPYICTAAAMVATAGAWKKLTVAGL